MILDSGSDVATASRIDEHTGVRETAGFFGSTEDQLFGVTHVPSGELRGAVVICSALHADFATNYRKEVLVARSLAGRGFAVQRFHYRGVGNSDGASRDLSLSSLTDDVRDARALVTSRFPGIPVRLLATRCGVLPAAAAARDDPGAPLAMWEPTLTGDGYTRDAYRALRIRSARDGDDGGGAEVAHREELELDGSGVIDVMGYPLHASFAKSIAGRSLEQELGSAPRPLMVVQLGPSERIRKGLADFLEGRRALGSPTSVRALIGEEPWWFTSAGWVPVERRPMTRQLVDLTVEWLASDAGVDA